MPKNDTPYGKVLTTAGLISLLVGLVGLPIGVLLSSLAVELSIGGGKCVLLWSSSIVFMVGACIAIVIPVIVLLRKPKNVFKGNIRNQIIFALFGVLSFILAGLATNNWPGEQPGLIAAWGIFSLAWISVSSWIFILHTLGLVLSIGRQLPLLNRTLFYYFVVSIPVVTIVLCCWNRFAGNISELILLFLLVVAVGYLSWKDFSKYPAIPGSSRYDQAARKIAKFLGG